MISMASTSTVMSAAISATNSLFEKPASIFEPSDGARRGALGQLVVDVTVREASAINSATVLQKRTPTVSAIKRQWSCTFSLFTCRKRLQILEKGTASRGAPCDRRRE